MAHHDRCMLNQHSGIVRLLGGQRAVLAAENKNGQGQQETGHAALGELATQLHTWRMPFANHTK
jgi:hypothetical protein